MRKHLVWPEKETYSRGTHIRLVHSGSEYFELLESMIRNSEILLHLQVYILEDDKTGSRIIRALEAASKRGVEVCVVVDAFGSNMLSDTAISGMKAAGIIFRKFSPFFTPKGLSIGRRLHHKIVVSDSKLALIGGINISDNYRGTAKEHAWIDYAIAVQGAVVEDAEKICNDILKKRRFFRKRTERHHRPAKGVDPEGKMIRLRQNDWLRKRRQITLDYRYSIRHSAKTVILLASYFLPGRLLTRILLGAARRGVNVKIILSGRSDAPFVKRGTNYLYRQLLGNNIEIFECTDAVVHGKVAVVDGEWCTIGSYNLNHLSDFGSIELNADLLDGHFSHSVERDLLKLIDEKCRQISLGDFNKNQTIFARAFDWTAHKLLRASMQLFFFLVRKNFSRQ